MSPDRQPFRIGHGYDVHRFADEAGDGAQIILCGCAIPAARPLLAHSDGDVAFHALTDALLGALALGDIGQHFPDNDPRYRGADSALLLTEAFGLVRARGYALANADLTIVAQAPRMAPHIPDMRQQAARCLCVSVSQISVKATTTERLGFTGREEGIAVYASVLVQAVEQGR